MPHPERRDAPALGGQDGARVFHSMEARHATQHAADVPRWLTIATSGCKQITEQVQKIKEKIAAARQRNKSAQPAPATPQPAAPAPPDVAATPPPNRPGRRPRCRCPGARRSL